MIRKNEVPAFVVRRRLRAQWKVLAELERQTFEAQQKAAMEKGRHQNIMRGIGQIF